MTTVIDSTNNGTPVLSYADEVGLVVDDYEINTLSAVTKTQHVIITSTGVDCGAAKISNVKSRTTAKTSPAGPVLIIGSDVSYAGNQKHNDSVVEYCDVFGSYAEDATIAANTGLHAIEVCWSLRPCIRHCRVRGADYGAVIKGGGYDNDGNGGLIGNIITYMGNEAVAPSAALTIKGLLNVPVCHNFIYQPRNKAFSAGAVYGNREAGAYNSGDIFFQNNVVILDNSGGIFGLSYGANIKTPRSNLYYSPNGSSFNGVSWATWLTNGKATDSDFEKGSIYIRNASFGATWTVQDDTGATIATLNYNPLTNHFRNIDSPLWLEESLYLKTGYLSGYVDYALKDFYGGKMFAVPNIGPDQGTGKGFGPWTTFDNTMPALALADTAPGSLLEVQEWTTPSVTKSQIDRVSR